MIKKDAKQSTNIPGLNLAPQEVREAAHTLLRLLKIAKAMESREVPQNAINKGSARAEWRPMMAHNIPKD